MRARAATVLMVLVIFAALGLAASLETAIEPALQPFRDAPETLWVQSGRVMRVLCLGHNGLAGDIYWTRAVQYYGSRLRDHKTDFHLLAPLLNITVDLDPQLMTAYYFGALFLSARPPQGAGDPQAAIALIRKGIAANPDEWRLWHYLGFIYYWELHDYQRAAEAYGEGAKNPRAAPFMKVMQAVIAEKGGSLQASALMWSEIYKTAEDPTIKANALRHLEGLRALDEIARLQRLVESFRNRSGRLPRDWSEMIAAGLLKHVPLDPERGQYVLHSDGSVSLQPGSRLRLEDGPTPPGL